MTEGARVKLVKPIDEFDLPAGALGSIVLVRNTDDRQYWVVFDVRPALRVRFFDPEFDPRSPEYAISVC